MKPKLPAALVAVFVLAVASAGFSGGFVKSDGSRLVLDGKHYRAIGVNMPSLFSDYMGIGSGIKDLYGSPEKARQEIIEGVRDAKRSNIAFIRFWASGFYPCDMHLCLENPSEYWKGMDEVFALCRENGVKLVPSIFFNIYQWPMMCDEHTQAISDPTSKTCKAMHKYLRELVTRYKDDTNILMWEITNEGFLHADVDMQGRKAHGKSAYLPGAKLVKTEWVREDSLSTAMLLRFYKDIAGSIKRIDPNHLVTSGDSAVRSTSVSLRENFPEQVWTPDTLRGNLASFLASQPEPLDVIGFHAYGPGLDDPLPDKLSSLEYAKALIRTTHAVHAPVFVGELANKAPSFKGDPSAKWTIEALDMMDKEGVDLMAIWAWHFPYQPENTVTSETSPALVKHISDLNKKYALAGNANVMLHRSCTEDGSQCRSRQ
ncbi:MAG: cellulase family glycosylhydrolase [Armatimonadetes bacterium]|nr:cellulase family glycosylhydrolase [Armatimonadota bacterium]